MRQRGECYAWLTHQSNYIARGDARAFAALLERVDSGDARFRSLRFQLDVPGLDGEATEILSGSPGAITNTEGSFEPAMLYRWTALGRHLASRIDELAAAAGAGRIDGLDPTAREALLHGVGLGLQAPRAVAGLDRVRDFIAQLERRLSELPPDDARAVAEGYGAQLGLIFDPYNRNLAEVLALHADLDPHIGTAFARGLA